MTAPVRIRAITATETAALRPGLGELLVDSVRHGASVGFLDPLAPRDADAYWQRVERAVAADACVLFVAEADDRLVGTVQLDVDTLPNQPHRATVSKLLVHTDARRRGIGASLMAALEQVAAATGRWLLTLDTATPAAARLYRRTGWQEAGVIPAYAMNPDRTLTATAFFYKTLDVSRAHAR
jgi:GNAT superfamily N-acetyltransferase